MMRTIRVRSLSTLAFGLGILLAAPVALCEQVTYADLPSEAAGGGTLALKVHWPDSRAEDRYEEGPPVAVLVIGGVSSGAFRSWVSEIVDQGFVVVEFLFPGGSSEGHSSDGVYDYRGERCRLALRDTSLFAQGALVDTEGRTIHDVVGRTVLTEVMGLTAGSNGGGLTAATLDLHQQELQGVRLVSFWENGMSASSQTDELGDLERDCDGSIDGDGNGFFDDDGKNPRFDPTTDYDYSDPHLDLSQLAWDPTVQTRILDWSGRFPPAFRSGVLFFDGNGNSVYDHQSGERLCTDLDGDGATGLDEDWLVTTRNTFTDDGRLRTHYAEPTTAYLEAHPEIFPQGWPEWVAGSDEAREYWRNRVGNRHLHKLGSLAGSLRVLHSYGEVFHSHTIEDLADARTVLDGCRMSNLWIRLQPDAAYITRLLGSAPAGYPDNPANIDVPMGQMLETAATGRLGMEDLSTTTLMELADRTYYGGWTDQLDEVLEAPGTPAAEAHGVKFRSPEEIDWDDDPTNLFFDVLRGDVAALAVAEDYVDLGPTSCIEEDSTDTRGTTPGEPSPGAAYFYLVRPGYIRGHYGASSAAQRRTAGATDCSH